MSSILPYATHPGRNTFLFVLSFRVRPFATIFPELTVFRSRSNPFEAFFEDKHNQPNRKPTSAAVGILPPPLASVAAWFSIWNALFACGDVFGFFLSLQTTL